MPVATGGNDDRKKEVPERSGTFPEQTMSMQVWIAIAVGVAATVDDLARRHIANWIPAAALAGGFGWQIGRAGWHGLLTGLGGAALGFCVFLIFLSDGRHGGGRHQVDGGFRSAAGRGTVAEAALWTAGIGGVLAIAALALASRREEMARRPRDGADAGRKGTEGFDSLRTGDHARRVDGAGVRRVKKTD